MSDPIILTVDEYIEAAVVVTDRYGNPVQVPGDVIWSSSDPAIIEPQPSSGDMVDLWTTGGLGACEVTVQINGTVSEVLQISVDAGAPNQMDVSTNVTDKQVTQPTVRARVRSKKK